MMSTLEAARDALAGIAGVLSCKVGIEPNISPASFPMIRLVPERVVSGRPYGGRTATVLIYFGAPTTTSEGIELVYADLFDLEAQIINVIHTFNGGRHLETITDGDQLFGADGRRLPYKLMAIRCELHARPEHASDGGIVAQAAAAGGAGAVTP